MGAVFVDSFLLTVVYFVESGFELHIQMINRFWKRNQNKIEENAIGKEQKETLRLHPLTAN